MQTDSTATGDSVVKSGSKLACRRNVDLAEFTTLGLGGPSRSLITVDSAEQAVRAMRQALADDEAVLVLAGGSNVVIGDAGFAGTTILLRSRGITILGESHDGVSVRAAAGHRLDELVAWTVRGALAGIECLSGIPGSVGATPIQNVGAYGQEIADVLTHITVYDRELDRVVELTAADCGLAYRTSALKVSSRYLVLDVTLRLRRDHRGGSPRYGELSRRLGGDPRPPLKQVRRTVLELRRGKGMVIDPNDPDTRSVGSFFTNPVVDEALVERIGGDDVPHWPQPDGRMKLAAAWLIEHAGFTKGYQAGGAGISSKHTLALVNRGGTTAELVELARTIRAEVFRRYGVRLDHEPVFVAERL
ncbi:MAG: UDP-N-acetylmuramate dehydrogenase [Mycobacteriales bacterium]